MILYVRKGLAENDDILQVQCFGSPEGSITQLEPAKLVAVFFCANSCICLKVLSVELNINSLDA